MPTALLFTSRSMDVVLSQLIAHGIALESRVKGREAEALDIVHTMTVTPVKRVPWSTADLVSHFPIQKQPASHALFPVHQP